MNPAGPLIVPPSSSSPSEASKRLLPWLVAVAFFHGVAGYDDSQYRRSCHLFRPRRRSPKHEGGAGELYAQPGGLHPNQWLDGGPVRHSSCIRICDWSIHPRVLFVRNINQHPFAGRLPHPARLRRRDDGAGGAASLWCEHLPSQIFCAP